MWGDGAGTRAQRHDVIDKDEGCINIVKWVNLFVNYDESSNGCLTTALDPNKLQDHIFSALMFVYFRNIRQNLNFSGGFYQSNS